MTKTIGFFGDSFCASNQSESWCNILQERLGCDRIGHFGEPGRSIWSVFFKFNELIRKNQVPDIAIFCWTEPYRLYHPELILSANTEPLAWVDPGVYKTLDNYWKYLHSYDKDEMAYEYALRHYDQNILSKLTTQIVQMWSFRPFETANKDAGIQLETGVFIDESMFAFSRKDRVKDGWGTGTINHMTKEQNQRWADRVYDAYMARY
jgi:hypothetical protein